MTNLTPKSQFDDVYQLERNDPALAGPGGVLNKPLQNLTNRTEFLNDTKANKTDIVKGQYSFTTLAKFNQKKATIPANSTVIIDEAGANQGTNTWDGNSLIKSPYDPVSEAKLDASTKAEAAKQAAITAAANDASTKAQAAETNAKLAAQNTDAKLLTSIQQIIDAVTQFRNDYDVDLAASLALVNSNDAQANTRIARLLLALQQVVLTISDNRDELDVLIAANTSSINTNNTAIATLQNSSANNAAENLAINSRITRLLVSIQQITQTFSENRDEIDVLITALNSTANNNIEISNRLNQSLQLVVHAVTQLNTDFNDSVASEAQKLADLLRAQEQALEFLKLDGFDPVSSGSNKYIEAEKIIFFEKPNNLVRIDVETSQNLPTAKGAVINTIISLNIDGQVLKKFGTLEVQGSSSAGYPKKNWTLGFFSDEARTTAVKIKVGDVPAHDEWIFKANFIDASHLRNILCNRLWGSIIQSRSGFPKLEIDRVYLGKTGTDAVYTNAIGRVEGYPCVLYINDEFYGIGDFNIGKKYFNYNLDRSNAKNILIDWGASQNDITKLSINYTDSTYFDVKSPKKITENTVSSLAAWDAFAASDQDSFTANSATHLLEKNIVDYWLFSQFIHNYDGLGKNFQFVNQGDDIFLFMPYDLDSTFGLDVLARFLLPANSILTKGDVPAATTAFWNKVKVTYANQLNTRYAELRKNGIFSVDHIYELALELLSKFTKDLVLAEQIKWSTVPSLEFSNLPQIMSWTKDRLVYLDNLYSYTP